MVSLEGGEVSVETRGGGRGGGWEGGEKGEKGGEG